MNRIAARVRCALALLSLSYAAAFQAQALAEQKGGKFDDGAVAGTLVQVQPTLLQLPMREPIEISAAPVYGNRLPGCDLSGAVTLWVSRRLRVLDDMRKQHAVVEAGLFQFGEGSRLKGCVPDGAALDLSEQFANFVVAAGGADQRDKALSLASQLAQGLSHLTNDDGSLVPLVAGVRARALGSVAHEYTIVLVRDAESRSYDAVIQRETVRTKFSPRLPEADRHLSRVKWSSARRD
jgi:hypothetical protein